MVRLYHKLRKLYSFPERHKRLTLLVCLLAFFVIFFAPFIQHSPLLLAVGQGLLFGNIDGLKSQDGRTNFVILGLGGSRSEPSSLTDTQQLFSYDHGGTSTSSPSHHLLISIPRDIWSPEFGMKINNLYSYGNLTEGSGIDLTKNAISNVTGQPINYSVMISFDGFTKLIDVLGGVDVIVENSFTDSDYPAQGRENDMCGGDPEYKCRWETITFEKGSHHFDGATALKFVRSRHARGDEGTDLARAARQQRVLLAIKKKIFSPSVILNPVRAEKLLSLFLEVLETDIPQKDLGVVAKIMLETRGKNIQTESISAIDPTNPDENLDKSAFLIHPPISQKYKNQWVLVPIGGVWEPTRNWIHCLITKGDCLAEDFALDWRGQKLN